MEASITLKNVSKQFKNRYILSNLSFGIEKGSTFVVLGRNGEGKSTFLKLLTGIIQPDNGNIYINGLDFSKNRSMIRTIGFLGDVPMYNSNLTVIENLKHRANLMDIPAKLFEENHKILVDRFFLKKYLSKKVAICSSGIKKRLSIVLSLLHDPAIIIWDEPLAYLDFNVRQILLNYLLEIKSKKTVVIATNEFTELHTIADRWVVLHNRSVRFDGDLEKMTTHIELPFLGQIELKKEIEFNPNKLLENSKAENVENIGNSINIQCKSFFDFHEILNDIPTESILRISCNSIDLEDLLNQLLSDEGLV